MENLTYAIGTLLTWTGWAFLSRAIYLVIKLAVRSPGLDRPATSRGVAWAGFAGAILLILAMATPVWQEPLSGSVQLPLTWFVMPFAAWGVVTCAVLIAVRLVQGWLALNQKERMDRLVAALIWALVGACFVYLYLSDPAHKISILKGAIPLSVTVAVVVAALIVAAMVAMASASRWASARGFGKTFAAQTALVAGSIVFGLPFAFLVITSFKEDRDMSSAEGIVWIPRVQESVEFKDPKRPLYVTNREGQRVTGVVLEELGGDRIRLEVEEPRAIRGTTFEASRSALTEIPSKKKLVSGVIGDETIRGMVMEDLEDGSQRVQVIEPSRLKGQEQVFAPGTTEPIRHIGLRTENYTEAISFLPPETRSGLVYVKNTLLLVVLSVIGTILSSSIVAYAFSRMKFPGRDVLFVILLSTMMLPAAVTMLPQFLIFRSFGWIDTLYPLWVPAFFASAFNVFLLRQFFKQIPMELEDAAKIDGASYPRTFWSVMLPQIKPALAVIAIWTFMGAWNNFMGPLIYINSPENMPLSYALQLFQGDRAQEPGLLMAFATMTIVPVLLVFFFAQRFFIEGVTLSGLGGR